MRETMAIRNSRNNKDRLFNAKVFLSSFITFVVLMFLHYAYFKGSHVDMPCLYLDYNEIQLDKLEDRDIGSNPGDGYSPVEPATPEVVTPEVSASPDDGLRNSNMLDSMSAAAEGPGSKPIVWIANAHGTVGQEVHDYRFKHKAAVLKELGFYIGDGNDDWDVLISFVNLFQHIKKRLKPYQKVSVMPGHDAITRKRELMKKGYPFMPKSFKIPEQRADYLQHMAEHPDQVFLEKREEHRGAGVLLANIDEITQSNLSRSLQQFISDPILVNGRKLEMSVYVALTSVNPLRVYINDGDWYFRMCYEQYHPFDIQKKGKYVLQSETNLKTWNMPALNAYDKYGLTHKETVFNYLRRKGYDTDKLEEEVRTIITKVYTDGEKNIIDRGQKIWDSFGTSRNFFDIVRCDFVFDQDLKPYLVEITDYPGSSTMKPRNKEQFRRVWHSAFHLLGFASYNKHRPMENSWLERDMMVVDRDLTTFTDHCIKHNCSEKCSGKTCDLCGPCLTNEDKAVLSDSFMENAHKYDWNRIIPKPFKSQSEARHWRPKNDQDYLDLEPRTQWLTRWYWGKCLKNHDWCM